MDGFNIYEFDLGKNQELLPPLSVEELSFQSSSPNPISPLNSEMHQSSRSLNDYESTSMASTLDNDEIPPLETEDSRLVSYPGYFKFPSIQRLPENIKEQAISSDKRCASSEETFRNDLQAAKNALALNEDKFALKPAISYILQSRNRSDLNPTVSSLRKVYFSTFSSQSTRNILKEFGLCEIQKKSKTQHFRDMIESIKSKLVNNQVKCHREEIIRQLLLAKGVTGKSCSPKSLVDLYGVSASAISVALSRAGLGAK